MTSKRIKPQEKLQIAIDKKTGEWQSIFEVPTGRECNCMCPDTELDLEAKNKNKSPDTPLRPGQKMAHFAIARGQDYEGEPSPETAIHKLAKEVFEETKTIAIPELACYEGVLAKSIEVEFDNVVTEDTSLLSEFDIIPDAVGEKESNKGVTKKLLIEFKKTHAVDEDKAEKIELCNISCIEIDLNGIPQLDDTSKPNRSGIQERFLNPIYAKWIYNAEEEALRKNLIKRIERQKREELIREEIAENEELIRWRKENEVELKRWRKEREEELKRRKRRTRGMTPNKYAEYIEEEKIEISLSQIPKYCKLINANKYVHCPKHHRSNKSCTLIDCYNCSFFYRIKTIPKTKSDYVICSFLGEEHITV